MAKLLVTGPERPSHRVTTDLLTTMIVLLLGLTMLLILATARRALEPVCPNCNRKSWGAHSTQLQCACCGWSNGRVPAAEAAPAPVEPQYEICFNG